MHTKTMEGLIGARTNINMTAVPMRVYKEARRKGDTATMERAMGYVNEFEDTAFKYKAKADEGMKEEAEEAKEQEKLEREEALEKRREERKNSETQANAALQKTDEQTQIDTDNISTVPATETDSVEISSKGQAMWKQAYTDDETKIPDFQPNPPVFYSSTGATTTNAQNDMPTLNISV